MGLKIYHLHPLVAGRLRQWPAHFSRIAAMGFDHVCLAPVFLPGNGGDCLASADPERLHPALGWDGSADQGLAFAAEQAAGCGLRLMLDVALDRVALSAWIRERQPDWFTAGGRGALPDPRRRPHRLDVAYARFDRGDAAHGLTEWWSERLGRLIGLGMAGFRFLDPDRTPPEIWQRLLPTLRTEAGDGEFLAWTVRLPRDSLARLTGVGFTRSIASTPWWNGRAAWLLAEIEALRRIAPVMGLAEPSFSERLATLVPQGADPGTAYRHALRVAAVTGDGLFVPMGFEFAARRGFDATRAGPADLEQVRQEAPVDLSDDIADANALVDRISALNLLGPARTLTAAADSGTVWVRADSADVLHARRAALIAINPDLVHAATLPIALDPPPPTAGLPLGQPTPVDAPADLRAPLAPSEVRVIAYDRLPPIVPAETVPPPRADHMASTRIAIEAISPVVAGGDFAVKSVVGRPVTVAADIIGDGHEMLAADLLWRPADQQDWRRVPMRKGDNDRWSAVFTPSRIGAHHFTVEAWWDRWGTFAHDLEAKHHAGQAVALEIQEGVTLLRHGAETASDGDRDVLEQVLTTVAEPGATCSVTTMLSDRVRRAMQGADTRPFAARHAPIRLWADRSRGEFASWYELFPRSVTSDPRRHGTFADVIERLPEISAMGFDVLYFPPIHPIGKINRKGRNNSLRAEPGDVGSPYAIGGEAGGHDALHPDLGTLDDFKRLVEAAGAHGLELAMDFAVQCAPDHPWLREHPDWFRWRPDGSMRYAENPPKKYEDIVNPDFYAEAAMPALWHALRDVIQFWVDQGVRIFRVDNPHTKPLPFWEWLIDDIHDRHPDVLFLAEAFTRPKLMYRLAKIGFSQSYTYFTWRNTKQELTDYLTELSAPPVSDFFRPNFFVNTPDINPVFLQTSGRPGFLIRAALATTLSGLWGMYSGFEICEAAPLPGREEYLDSEKYEIRPRDYAAPGNIVGEITMLNRLRRSHPALQSHTGLRFHAASDDQVLLYAKQAPGSRELVLVAVSLDPHNVRACDIDVPLWQLGLPDSASVAVRDLIREHDFVWTGRRQSLRLDPADMPFAIWCLSPIGVA
ncbi:MAG: maltotransferase domain-containing protein [Acetobacteraceae bacterium]